MKKFLAYILLLNTSLLYAQQFSVLKTDAPETVPFAQPFKAQVVLSHPRTETVTVDKESVPPEFTLQAVHFQPVGVDSTQADLTILPFTLNKSTFTISFALSGQPENILQTQLPLTVTPVKVFNDNNFREIRPPRRVFNWVTWLCVLLALTALTCLLIFWWRKLHRQQQALLSSPMDNRPPHVIALSQIDGLLNSGLWENKQYKVFYITLSDILRTYLQRAFGLDVSADTSAELLRRLKTVPALVPLLQDTRRFLSSGDLVKFARAVPTETVRNRDITLLRGLIEKTAPKPAAPAPKHEVRL